MDFKNEQLSQELMDLNRLLDGVDYDPAQQMGILSGYVPTLIDAPSRIDDYCRYILMLEDESGKQKSEAERLMDLSEINSTKVNCLKSMLNLYLQLWKTPHYRTESFKIDVAPAEKMTVIIDVDAEDLPEEYVKHSSGIFPDINKIRTALQSGIDVAGCMLGGIFVEMIIEPESKD